MARIFKATYTKMRTLRDYKDNVIYAVRNGRKVARLMPVLGKNGKSVLGQTRKWYVEYRDADGIVRRRAGFTDKKATEQLAAQLEREAAQRKTGLIDRHAEYRKRPLKEHLSDWRENLTARGNTEKYAEAQVSQALTVVEGCRFRSWPELSAGKVQAFVAERRKDTNGRRGISSRTANSYLQAIKQFCQWMVNEDRAPDNPLAHLKRYNEQVDRPKVRRALIAQECQLLLEITEQVPMRYGVSGRDRARYTVSHQGRDSGPMKSRHSPLPISHCSPTRRQ